MRSSVLTRYRVMAYVTGVLLLMLCAAMVGKYLLHLDGAAAVTTAIGIAHGWLYVVYLVVAFDLGQKARWPMAKQLRVLLAGTIPTAAFFVERRVVRELAPMVALKSPEPVDA